MVYSKRDGHWRPLTWSQAGQRVDAAAMGLCALGLEKGQRVAIISANCVEWVIADLASISAGLVDVPIGEDQPASTLVWMLRDSGCQLAFVEDEAMVKILCAHRNELPDLKYIIYFHGPTPDQPPVEGIVLMGLLELEKMGRERALVDQLEQRRTNLGPADLLTIIYTSGTTDQPKGVMLTHGNILANCEACARAISVRADDEVLSFLPLSHSFERMAAYYMAALFGGATLYHAEGFDALAQNLNEVKPTIMTAVPRLYEQFHTAAMVGAQRAGPLQKLVLQIGLSGRGGPEDAQPGWLTRPLVNLQKRLTQDHALKPFAEQFGGRIRFLISGGGHLAPTIARFYEAAGLTILEGYGLTEAAPVVAVNRLKNYRFGTVGRPLDNVRLRIDVDGEILVKGPNVMQGYWNREEETRRVLDANGWLSTGDIGEISRDGYLKLKDRISDQLTNAQGQRISPQNAEALLVSDPMVHQACVAGDGRPYCVALIVPSPAFMKEWAMDASIPFHGSTDLIDHPQLDGYFRRLVSRCNELLEKSESIGAYHLVEEPFARDRGLLTSTLKLRRLAIIDCYSAEIDSLYAVGSRRKDRVDG